MQNPSLFLSGNVRSIRLDHDHLRPHHRRALNRWRIRILRRENVRGRDRRNTRPRRDDGGRVRGRVRRIRKYARPLPCL